MSQCFLSRMDVQLFHHYYTGEEEEEERLFGKINVH